jgi:hypothetical protein
MWTYGTDKKAAGGDPAGLLCSAHICKIAPLCAQNSVIERHLRHKATVKLSSSNMSTGSRAVRPAFLFPLSDGSYRHMNTLRSLGFAVASALTLAIAMPTLASAQDTSISNSDIARYKSLLRLTSTQSRMWPTVAAALRAYSHKKRTVVELIPVVSPFYRALDENQQQVARSLAQQLGLGSYAMLM